MLQTVQTHNIAKAPTSPTSNTQSTSTNRAFNSLSNLGMPSSNSSMASMLALISQMIQQTQGGNTQSNSNTGTINGNDGRPAPTPTPTPNTRGHERPVRPGPAPAPINNGPTARNDRSTTAAGTPVTLNVLANDTDPDRDTLRVTGFANPANGTVRQDGNRLIYTPNAGFAGTETFTYTMGDGRGGISTATATVTVQSPLENTRLVGTEDTALRVRWSDLQLPANIDGVKFTTLPADGKLTFNNQPITAGQVISHSDFTTGQLVFTPDANESGTDAYRQPGVGNQMSDYAKIEYAATKDGAVVSNPAKLTIDITPVADNAPRLTSARMASHSQTAADLPDGFNTQTPVVDGKSGYLHYIQLSSTDKSNDTDGSERSIYRLEIDQYDAPNSVNALYLADGTRLQANANGEYEVPSDTDKVWVFRQAHSHQRLIATTYNQELDKDGKVLQEVKGNTITSNTNTPLILDLNGDGVQTIGAQEGAEFDFTGNGETTQTGWVAPEDGLLVLDRDGNGRIDSGQELFGDSTHLANGDTAEDGFEALAQYDTNKDGQINKLDGIFEELQVWTDTNSDGISQADELHSLDEVGVASLGLQAEETDIKQNGNTIGLQGSFTKTDGTEAEFSDVWFNTTTFANDE